MTLPTVRVVTVTFYSAAFIRRCVQAVLADDGRGFQLERMVVVDNASGDNTADAIPDHPRLTLVRNDVNRGFAAACNQGARGSHTDFLLFLNPDAAPGPGSIGEAVRTLLSRADAAVCGVRFYDADGHVSVSAARRPRVRTYLAEMLGLTRLWPSAFPGSLQRLEGSGVVEVDQVSGAFFLIRRHVFDEFDGFDERYFVYYEEADLSARLRRRGWLSVCALRGLCVHDGGVSAATVGGTSLFWNLRSRIVFARRHMRRHQRWGLVVLTVVLEPVLRMIFVGVTTRSVSRVRAVWIAYLRLLWWFLSVRSASGAGSL